MGVHQAGVPLDAAGGGRRERLELVPEEFGDFGVAVAAALGETVLEVVRAGGLGLGVAVDAPAETLQAARVIGAVLATVSFVGPAGRGQLGEFRQVDAGFGDPQLEIAAVLLLQARRKAV